MSELIDLEGIDLSNYDSSSRFSSMDDSLDNVKSNKLALQNISTKANFNDELIIYDENVLYNYKNYLSQYRVPIAIDEGFYYRPELLSEKIYGTPDLWYLILWMNDEIESPMDFDDSEVYVFDPNKINIINKIIESNKDKINQTQEEPQYVENLLIKEVVVSDNRVL
jgi:hypothetical protein